MTSVEATKREISILLEKTFLHLFETKASYYMYVSHADIIIIPITVIAIIL